MVLPKLDGRVILEIEGICAAVAYVRINGSLAGMVAWPPHRVDVTNLLRPGENQVEIELVGTLRNLLGPHHQAGGDGELTSPNEFRDRNRWIEDVILVPFGFESVSLAVLK
jgi:hypothetical protein